MKPATLSSLMAASLTVAWPPVRRCRADWVAGSVNSYHRREPPAFLVAVIAPGDGGRQLILCGCLMAASTRKTGLQLGCRGHYLTGHSSRLREVRKSSQHGLVSSLKSLRTSSRLYWRRPPRWRLHSEQWCRIERNRYNTDVSRGSRSRQSTGRER